MIGEPKPPGNRLRFGPGFPQGAAVKLTEEPKLRMRGLKTGAETVDSEREKGEALRGRILIQRDSGKQFRIFEYNHEGRRVRLEEVGGKMRVTLGIDDLLGKLATTGGPWKME